MTIKDASTLAGAGSGVYNPDSPFRSVTNTIDFALYGLGASGADSVNLAPLNVGEYVQAAFYKVVSPTGASVTLKVDDGRSGGGALIAATAGDAAANTIVVGAGAGLNKPLNAAGYATMTTVAAFAASAGKVAVTLVIGRAF